MWRRVILAFVVLSVLPWARATAFSGGEMLTPEQVLAQTDLIVIARPGEFVGTVDRPGSAPVTYYTLHVESYLRPAMPGPQRLVVAFPGGMSLHRAVDGPQPHTERALYFLHRGPGVSEARRSRMIPTIPLQGDQFDPNVRGTYHAAFQPLLDGLRYPAYLLPAVRVDGRQVGYARLDQGRAQFPAEQLAPALGISLPQEGFVPLRAIAEAQGAEVLWSEEAWVIDILLGDPPAEPTLLDAAVAVERLASAVDAIIAEGMGGGSFAEHYTALENRLIEDWVDPRTGAEQAVWEIAVGFAPHPEKSPSAFALVDAVTGEVLFYQLAHQRD